MRSVKLTGEVLKKFDVVLLITDHTALDYALIEKHAKCIIDTRNAFRKNGIKSEKIFMA
jgi:UDP-N-acetyl-D-glucosamine dehydrogenase